MDKKKLYLIIFIIITLIPFLVVLYIKTDFLKTKELLFWKYFVIKKDEIVNIVSNDDIKAYSDEKQKSSYIKKGNISVESEHQMLGKINMELIEKGNQKEDYKNISVDLNYDDKNILNAYVIKDDNYYFIRSNLSGSEYVGFENNNLKQLAQNLGIDNVEFIPNKIREIDYLKLFSLSDEEQKHISNKYISICRKYVKNKDYIIKENVKDDLTTYELQLSKQQIKELIIAILDELYNDDYALTILSKKIKIIDDESNYCNISNIKEKIEEIKQFLMNKEADEEKFLSIIIYKNKNNVEKIEIVLKDDRTISIENNNNEIIIKQHNVENCKFKFDTISNTIETILNSITEITYSNNIKDENTKEVAVKVTCNFGIEKIILNYNYEEQIKDSIDDIIRKDDIKYVELKKFDIENYKTTLKDMLKINVK